MLDATNDDVCRVKQLSCHADLNAIGRYDDNRQGLQGNATRALGDLLDSPEAGY